MTKDTLSSELPTIANVDSLFQRISSYLHQAKQNVLRSIDTELLKAYWNIGKEIVEEEQKGLETELKREVRVLKGNPLIQI